MLSRHNKEVRNINIKWSWYFLLAFTLYIFPSFAQAAPPMVTLLASPSTVAPGGSVSLVWWQDGTAVSCTAGSSAGDWTGSLSGATGAPSFSSIGTSRSYDITCTNAAGEVANKVANIVVSPVPPTDNLVAVNLTHKPAGSITTGDVINFEGIIKNIGSVSLPGSPPIAIFNLPTGDLTQASGHPVEDWSPTTMFSGLGSHDPGGNPITLYRLNIGSCNGTYLNISSSDFYIWDLLAANIPYNTPQTIYLSVWNGTQYSTNCPHVDVELVAAAAPVAPGWYQLSQPPLPVQEDRTFAFNLNGKGYIGSSYGDGTWEYTQTGGKTGTWQKMDDYLGSSGDTNDFSIGNKGYSINLFPVSKSVGDVGGETWEFDPTRATGAEWKAMDNFPGKVRRNAATFAVNGKGYVVGGQGNPANNYGKEVWEFDPTRSAGTRWKQIGDAVDPTKAGTVLGGYAAGVTHGNYGIATQSTQEFVIGNFAYLLDERTNLFKFDPAGNGGLGSWTWLSFNAMGLNQSIREWGFTWTIAGKGYLTTGYTATWYRNDLWEYTPNAGAGTWTQRQTIVPLPAGQTSNTYSLGSSYCSYEAKFVANGFVIGGQGYLFGGAPCAADNDIDLWTWVK